MLSRFVGGERLEQWERAAGNSCTRNNITIIDYSTSILYSRREALSWVKGLKWTRKLLQVYGGFLLRAPRDVL